MLDSTHSHSQADTHSQPKLEMSFIFRSWSECIKIQKYGAYICIMFDVVGWGDLRTYIYV